MSWRFRAELDAATDARKIAVATSVTSTDAGQILKGALVSGAISGTINGIIQAFQLRGAGPVKLSVDLIGADTRTVLSTAVPLAVSLAAILTVVAYLTLKAPKQPFWPAVPWLIVKHSLFAFGALVAAAVVWQRLAGTVEVSVATAVALLAVTAGIVAATVNFMTISAVVLPKT
jgi:hypothetical protein